MKRISELEAFVKYLRASDPRDDSVFQYMLSEGMDLLEYNDEDCARLFDVSRPTVTRWRNGSTAPHRAIRLPLRNVLKREVSKRVKLLERRKGSEQAAFGILERRKVGGLA